MVIDATYRYKRTNCSLCSIKVVDKSQNLRHPLDPDDYSNSYCNITIFSKDINALPVVKKVGDIIRVHRANVTKQ